MNVVWLGMNRIPDDRVMRAWARLVRAQDAVMTAVERALKSADLPPLSWYDALLEIERSGADGIRPFELEKELLLPQYGLSRLLSRLENAGYTVRKSAQDDGRGHRVAITDEGRRIREAMWPVYAQAIDDSFAARLTSSEIGLLTEALGKIVAGNRIG